jgi:putative N6-adenine-specific DNA methylase
VKPAFHGLHFTATPEALYRITYTARIISRVHAPLIVFDCHSTDYLYKTARHCRGPASSAWTRPS